MNNHYEVIAIPALKDNYIWALIDKSQNTLVIIDPGEAKPVLDFIADRQLKLCGILITHHHWDHVNGVEEIIKHYPVPVYGPSTEQVAGVSLRVDESVAVIIPGFSIEFRVLFIPGHTKGHIAYYAPEMVFCGDTLFAAGCGRLFEGTAEQMHASLSKLAALPQDTRVYCAHEYTESNLKFAAAVEPGNQDIVERAQRVAAIRASGKPSLPSVMKDELATNPFLRSASPEVKTSAEQHAGMQLKSEVEVFAAVRKWKDNF